MTAASPENHYSTALPPHPPLGPGEAQGPQDSARALREAAASLHR